jgi:hypothetical protein
MSPLPVLVLGFLLGIKHASEADHLAAVATLVTRAGSLRHTVRQGIAWGIGHAATLAVVGGIVLALGHAVPPRLTNVLELAVGVMLILLGVDVLRRLRLQRLHIHLHQHAGVWHLHAHSHQDSLYAGPPRHWHTEHRHTHPSTLRALAVGMMHGMAGSAALVVLALGTVGSWPLGLLYIAIFGAGSILGMALLSIVVAMPLRLTAAATARWHHAITALVGLFSCGLGAAVVYRIGWVGGLLLR